MPDEIDIPAPRHDVEPATQTETETETETEDSRDELPNQLLNDLAGPVSVWAGKTTTETSVETGSDQSSCIDFVSAYPQSEISLRPGLEEVRLVVPSTALRPVEQDFSGYSTGGMAGLINYDFLSTTTESGGSETQYRSLNTEAGMNIGDWSLRSRQSLVEFNGERTAENLYAFAEHSLVGMKSLLQIGQINIASPIFPGSAITGVQLLPDNALRPRSQGGVTISGIAQTSQARVELTQNGIVVFTTVVPTGPFTLRNIPLLQGNTDVVMTVYESDGSQHSDRIAAASLRTVELVAEGFSIAAGQVRDIGDSGSDTPPVVTLSNGWLVGEQSVLAAGLMLTPDYRAIGWDLGTEFTADTSLSLNSVMSQASELGERGIQNSATLNTRLTESLTLSASATRRSPGYLDLTDTTQTNQDDERFFPFDPFDPFAPLPSDEDNDGTLDDLGQPRTEYSLSLGWNAQPWGAGNLSYSQSEQGGGQKNRSVSASWGTRIGIASVNANFRHELDEEDGNGMYLSVSLPLGRSRSIRAFSSESNGRGQVGATYNETVSDTLSYSLSTTKADDADSPGMGATVSALPRYAQVNLGYNQDDVSKSSNIGVSGGLVFHRQGITASPYAVQDTFGIAAVGDIGGIKLSTPSGPVWTDAGGRAVVAQLPAFSSGSVEVITNTLPRNVDLNNGYRAIDAGRGSVNLIDFGVVSVRRVLLTAVDAQGAPLPKGASVVDAQDRFVTTVVDGGKIFLVDATQQGLIVTKTDGTRCTLDFELPEEVDLEVHFEQLPAQCRPLF
ncbi:fimbria/pilus outer membrane usher protein [Pseudomonas sp. NPDC098747]|uniref:fimbria/pilus outer membrane usher protein n=1 Tax=Pseudomonas sp. NPDC098747 TaxID=3364487 RepID=UPI00383BE87B